MFDLLMHPRDHVLMLLFMQCITDIGSVIHTKSSTAVPYPY